MPLIDETRENFRLSTIKGLHTRCCTAHKELPTSPAYCPSLAARTQMDDSKLKCTKPTDNR